MAEITGADIGRPDTFEFGVVALVVLLPIIFCRRCAIDGAAVVVDEEDCGGCGAAERVESFIALASDVLFEFGDELDVVFCDDASSNLNCNKFTKLNGND